MANLNKYDKNKQQEQQQSTTDKLANQAKHQVKQKAKKEAKNKAKDAFHKATDNQFRGVVGKAKGLARQGVKAAIKALKAAAKQAAKALAEGIKALIEFLISNPIGWVILVILIVILIIFLVKKGVDKKNELDEQKFMEDSFSTIMLSDADCQGIKKKTEMTEAETEVDNKKKETAHKIYVVFHDFGLSDVKIAGMLGNMETETTDVDPTCVEGVCGREQFSIGETKQKVLDDMDSYCKLTLFPAYDRNGVSYTKSGYRLDDGKYYCGVGLCQWTKESTRELIQTAGDQPWYTLEFQLAMMLTDKFHRKDFFKTWKEKDDGSAEAEAIYFRHKYEGNTVNGQDSCQTNATKWLNIISTEWNVAEEDSTLKTFVNNLFDMARNLGDISVDTIMSIGRKKCRSKLTGYDNSSMAAAAVSYAYATHEEGEGNNGTALYQKVHDNLWGSGDIYMSCDRSVAAAVLWSGTDDDFPAGDTNTQYQYMKDSDKWESLGKSTDSGIYDNLQPGDILILNGHVLMFVGHDLINNKHGNNATSDSDSVSGSYGTRSPTCCNNTTDLINRCGGQDWDGRGEYEIFRCTKPDNSDKYKNAGG